MQKIPLKLHDRIFEYLQGKDLSYLDYREKIIIENMIFRFYCSFRPLVLDGRIIVASNVSASQNMLSCQLDGLFKTFVTARNRHRETDNYFDNARKFLPVKLFVPFLQAIYQALGIPPIQNLLKHVAIPHYLGEDEYDFRDFFQTDLEFDQYLVAEKIKKLQQHSILPDFFPSTEPYFNVFCKAKGKNIPLMMDYLLFAKKNGLLGEMLAAIQLVEFQLSEIEKSSHFYHQYVLLYKEKGLSLETLFDLLFPSWRADTSFSKSHVMHSLMGLTSHGCCALIQRLIFVAHRDPVAHAIVSVVFQSISDKEKLALIANFLAGIDADDNEQSLIAEFLKNLIINIYDGQELRADEPNTNKLIKLFIPKIIKYISIDELPILVQFCEAFPAWKDEIIKALVEDLFFMDRLIHQHMGSHARWKSSGVFLKFLKCFLSQKEEILEFFIHNHLIMDRIFVGEKRVKNIDNFCSTFSDCSRLPTLLLSGSPSLFEKIKADPKTQSYNFSFFTRQVLRQITESNQSCLTYQSS